MNADNARLMADLDILENMAASMEDYLAGSAVYGRSDHPDMPPVSLGGVFLRTHRLRVLADRLDAAGRQRLDALQRRLDAFSGRDTARFREKMSRELDARLHLWQGHLQEMAEDGGESPAEYATTVETRALIAALIGAMEERGVRVAPATTSRLAELDQGLAGTWRAGDFIWPDGWQPAYPREHYWWLYGRPEEKPRG